MTREEWKKVIKAAYDEAHIDRRAFDITATDTCVKLLGYIYRAL